MSSTDTPEEEPFRPEEEEEEEEQEEDEEEDDMSEADAARSRDERRRGSSRERSGRSGDRASRRTRGFFERLFGDRLYGQPALQYLIGLKATFMSLDRPTDEKRKAIWTEVERIFAKYSDDGRIVDEQAAWDDSNRCERLLVNLYDSTRLDVELDRRILEAQQIKLDFASFYAGRQMKATADKTLTDEQENANRSLLSRLIQDQQWHDNKLYLKRSYAHTAQMRVSIAFLVALVLFGTTMISAFHMNGSPAIADADPGQVNKPEALAMQPEQNP